ncbi:Zinc finger HIT domain-containing protein 3 [Halocaridina rubra]|uniref:Zinc finger HIT domain-containing protein 3 n=1 Tax=Halocaridina rubra TaxID=373956 RepID=A0AAN9A2N6_HALRR
MEAMEQPSMSCEICNNTDFRYKCPTCRLKYCSVSCYRTHREKSCEPKLEEITIEIDRKGNSSYHQVLFPTDDTVSLETLEKLSESKELKKLLQNPHLCDIIKEVDSHPNPKLMMSRAMREPIFTEFTDVCLNIAEPPPQEEQLSD